MPDDEWPVRPGRADRHRVGALSVRSPAEAGVVRMTANDLIQVVVYLTVLLALVWPVGRYMAKVFADAPNRVTRFGAPAERALYRLAGIHADREMDWKRYAIAMLVFNVLGALAVYLLQRVQQWLPLNPQHFGAV